MQVELTQFCILRHFTADRPGTVITDHTPKQFQDELNRRLAFVGYTAEIVDGYADFCKLVFVKNWTNAKTGTLPITDENRHLLKSDYKARVDGELPVLTRWFEGIDAPTANYLCVVVYSKEQIEKEDGGSYRLNADWGVVAILGQMHDSEEPMNPITMMRNALGTAEGGSGFPLDRAKYMDSVRFWQSHAVVKHNTQSDPFPIKMQRDALLDAINLLVDDEECHLDHHGNCQTHRLRKPCDVMLSRKLIAKVTEAIITERAGV